MNAIRKQTRRFQKWKMLLVMVFFCIGYSAYAQTNLYVDNVTGTNHYATFKAAIDAANALSGDVVIRLRKNTVESSPCVIAKTNGSINVIVDDANRHSIQYAEKETCYNNSLVNLENGIVTLGGEGHNGVLIFRGQETDDNEFYAPYLKYMDGNTVKDTHRWMLFKVGNSNANNTSGPVLNIENNVELAYGLNNIWIVDETGSATVNMNGGVLHSAEYTNVSVIKGTFYMNGGYIMGHCDAFQPGNSPYSSGINEIINFDSFISENYPEDYLENEQVINVLNTYYPQNTITYKGYEHDNKINNAAGVYVHRDDAVDQKGFFNMTGGTICGINGDGVRNKIYSNVIYNGANYEFVQYAASRGNVKSPIVINGAEGTMSGGRVFSCLGQLNGGGLLVTSDDFDAHNPDENYEHGSFTVTGGEISYCESTYGGAARVEFGTTVLMSGGKWSHCVASHGALPPDDPQSSGGSGGLRLVASKFVMSGDAEISYNYASSSDKSNSGGGIGAVWTTNFGDINTWLELNGGKVCYNKAGAWGGGIAANDKNYTVTSGGIKVILNGGEIYGNISESGGGLYVSANADLVIENNTKIYNNTATNIGGGVYTASINTSATVISKVVVNAASIYGNSAVDGGGLYSDKSDVFVHAGADIYQNTASNNGGAIFITGNGNYLQDGGNIGKLNNSNIATNGGGVYVSGGNVSIEGGTIAYNEASSNGGGFCVDLDNTTDVTTIKGGAKINNNKAYVNGGGAFVNKGQLVVQDASTKIFKNTAENDGGGIYMSSGSISVTNASFEDNSAINGGGIFAAGSVTVTGSSHFYLNKASNHGGAIFVNGGNSSSPAVFTLEGGTVGGSLENGNTAGNNGGGFYVTGDYSSVILRSGEVSYNNASSGGGFYVNKTSANGTQLLQTVKLNNNTAKNGGGVYVYSGNLIIDGTNIEVKENLATPGNGGGFYLRSGNITIKGTGTISNNSANLGGAIFTDQTSSVVTIGEAGSSNSFTISENHANVYGGAIRSGGNITIHTGVLSKNNANRSGGAIYVNGGTFTMNGGTIGGTISEGNYTTATNNSSYGGGGLYVNGGTAIVNNGTISGNHVGAGTNGGGVFIGKTNSGTEGTCNISGGTIGGNSENYANSAELGGGIYMDGGLMTFSNGSIDNNYASMQGGGVYIKEGAILYLKGSAAIKNNHVPAPIASEPNKGKGGGVYLGGTLYVGENANDPLGTHKLSIANNYAGDTYQYSLEAGTNNRNNVYLPSYEKVITLLSDISNANSKENVETRIGFSVDQGFKPVIKVLEDNQKVWLANLMPHEGTVLTGAIFDDKEKYVAVNGINDDDLQIYLWGCWTTVVNSNPNANLTEYPLPSGVEAHYTIDNEGESDETWHIYTSEGLSWFSSYVNGLNAYVNNPHRGVNAVLENNVDMNGFLWVPIGAIKSYDPNDSSFEEDENIDGHDTNYTGNFDGQGHIVYNLECGYLTGIRKYGLFGSVNDGTVTNTFVDNFSFTLTEHDVKYKTGGIAGVIVGTTIVSNCVARGTTIDNANSSGKYIRSGGLIGELAENTSPKVHSCMAMPEFIINNSKNYNLGGLVGVNYMGTIENCYCNMKRTNNTSSSAGEQDLRLGILAGYNNGTIENCYVNMQQGSANLTTNEGWFVGYNASSSQIMYCYAPSNSPYLGRDDANGASLIGIGTYADTQLDDNDKYFFNHSDQQVTADNDYVENDGILNTGELKGLQATLNNWVEAQTNGVPYSTWTRTMASTINKDLPILKFNDFAFVGSKDGIYTEYGNNPNTVLTAYNAADGGGSIYLYNSPAEVVTINNDNDVKLYFGQDAGIKQANGNTLNARVGVTLDNSDASMEIGNAPYDWHMFATPLVSVSRGITYSQEYININNSTWGDAGVWPVNPPVNSLTFGDGYLPSNTPYGNPYTAESFDFYCFDESSSHWINFKRHSGDHWYNDAGSDGNHPKLTYNNETNLERGKGYLVAFSKPTMLMADGTLNNGDVNYTVSASGYASGLAGVNLVGNPYQSYLDFNEFADVNEGKLVSNIYYILDADKKGYIAYTKDSSEDENTAPKFLHPHQGFFVRVNATGAAAGLKFTNDMRLTSGTQHSYFRGETPNYPLVSMACTDAEGRNDFATVELDRPEQGGGEKIKGLHAGDASLWFHFDDTDYQTAFTTPGLTTAPLRFKAYENGTFTLRWGTANGEFSYLHLIDNMTGMDIDCLTTDSYSFEGKTDDYTSRFKLVFGMPSEDDDEDDGASTSSATFAFQMGDELVVNGEGMLQMFDVNGRCLMSTELYGQQNTIGLPTAAAGVYVFRLTSGENVKVQKMVVR